MIRTRWSALWRRLGATSIPAIEPLLTRLAEPHRHYHTLTHIRHCLSIYDRGPARDDAVELALWFHDAIYDPQARDNEERSAIWCQGACRDAGVRTDLTCRAVGCIRATRHRDDPMTIAEALTVSVDLAILGECRQRFRRYDQAIRREFRWVPMSAYREGRSAVLRSFLQRSSLYPHPWFERYLGHRARMNLRQALARLTAPGADSPDRTR